MAFENGPFVQFACFCDMILEDKTGAVSLIRIVDTINHTVSNPNPPDKMPPLHVSLKLAIAFKSGSSIGRHDFKIVPELPNGSTLDPIDLSVYFKGEEKGCNVIVPMDLICELEGLYWFEVFIDNEKITSIPLRIRYNRIVLGRQQL